MDSQHRLISLGRVAAPFWLDPVEGLLRALVRVTESDRDTRTPDYNMVVISPPQERVEQLSREVADSDQARMLIERLVDAVPSSENQEGRGLGRQVLAMAYGDFCHVVQVGGMTGLNPADSL